MEFVLKHFNHVEEGLFPLEKEDCENTKKNVSDTCFLVVRMAIVRGCGTFVATQGCGPVTARFLPEERRQKRLVKREIYNKSCCVYSVNIYVSLKSGKHLRVGVEESENSPARSRILSPSNS